MIVPISIIVIICFICFFELCSLERANFIEGVIIENNIFSFSLMNNDDTIYQIDNEIKSDEGSYVRIKYYGKLDYLANNNIDIRTVEKATNPFNNKIMDYVKYLSTEEKVGQLIMAKVPSYNKIETITNYKISGYIYYAGNIGSKSIEELQEEIKSFQENSNIPLLIAIDEEGGTVSRLSGNKKLTQEPFRSPQELYDQGGFDLITKDAIRKRDLLVNLGFNVNYAPVIDVVTDTNAYMYKRSFGKSAEETAKFAKTILDTQTKEMTYTFKHFPGYGNNVDTHITKSNDNRSLDDFDNNDFIPYIEAINNGAKQIMISHNIINSIDDKPSSLSLKMHNILRERLDFKGVIITDSLSMGAITNYETNPYVAAVKSGNNLIITENASKAYEEILEAIQYESISDSLLDRLVYRVIELKLYKGLLTID